MSSSQEMYVGSVGVSVGDGVIDENMNQPVNQLGSLFSIHSAPVFDLNGGAIAGAPSPKRPASLAVQATATSTPIVPPHLQSPEGTVNDDDDNDNLLTISSLTARPLIAKSRELRSVSKRNTYTYTGKEGCTNICTRSLGLFGKSAPKFFVEKSERKS